MQSGHHHHFIEINLFSSPHDIAENMLTWR